MSVSSINQIRTLDCTLRDGGYYCNWVFDNDLINNYLEAMDALKVDYVELGFRSSVNNKFKGGLAYTTDAFLNSLRIPRDYKIKLPLWLTVQKLQMLRHRKQY